MSNSSLQLTELDFNGLKASLKQYLKSQEIYKDYDFEESNLSVLIDVLAYNSFKNAFLINMLFSESWLDSAQLRASVLSRAKELNYLVTSKKSARAKVTVSFKASGQSQPYIIPKGSSFSSLVKSSTYVFSIPEAITVSSVDENFSFTTEIFEGVYLKDSYVYDFTKPNSRFKISNKNVDTSSIVVKVFEDNKLIGDTYTQATTLLGVNETSKVYFIQASDNGQYEIIFGDGILGQKPKDNAVIIIDYRISNDIAANGAREFGINFDPTGDASEIIDDINVVTLETALGGTIEESLDSVKYYAPRHFQVQERAVVASDYSVLLKKEFPEINAISVIGGEDMNPPQYGKVFISVDIANVLGFPESKKKQYADFINRRMNLSIRPVFISPEYTYYSINGKVKYNTNITSSSRERIRSVVISTINDFDTKYLNNFDVTLLHSQLSDTIDGSDPSVVSCDIPITVYKKFQPRIGVTQTIKLDFGIPIDDTFSETVDRRLYNKKRAVYSSFFTYSGLQCFLESDELDNINIATRSGDYINKITNVGKVDRAKGIVTLNMKVDAYTGNFIKVYVVPKEIDIAVSKNNILKLEQDEINIDAVGIKS